MVELDEGLERDAKPAAIVEDRVVVVGDAPWAGIEVEAGVETARLGRAAELGVDVAAADRPVPAAGTAVVFEDFDFVAGPAELERRGHAGEARAEDQDGRPMRIAIEFDRAAIRRFRRKAEAHHASSISSPAGPCADALEERTPGQGRRGGIAHARCFSPPPSPSIGQACPNGGAGKLAEALPYAALERFEVQNAFVDCRAPLFALCLAAPARNPAHLPKPCRCRRA